MNQIDIPQTYIDSVKSRSTIKYIIGLIVRWYKWIKYSLNRSIALFRGATIGRNSIIPFALAWKANSNLSVGDDCVIEAIDIDLRGKVSVSHHVIINKDVKIIRASHLIDDTESYASVISQPLIICPYSWLATGCVILPSVRLISKGSIIGAMSVLPKDTEEMGVYAGNPAIRKRFHTSVFSNIVLPSLMGGDYEYYINARHFQD